MSYMINQFYIFDFYMHVNFNITWYPINGQSLYTVYSIPYNYLPFCKITADTRDGISLCVHPVNHIWGWNINILLHWFLPLSILVTSIFSFTQFKLPPNAVFFFKISLNIFSWETYPYILYTALQGLRAAWCPRTMFKEELSLLWRKLTESLESTGLRLL